MLLQRSPLRLIALTDTLALLPVRLREARCVVLTDPDQDHPEGKKTNSEGRYVYLRKDLLEWLRRR